MGYRYNYHPVHLIGYTRVISIINSVSIWGFILSLIGSGYYRTSMFETTFYVFAGCVASFLFATVALERPNKEKMESNTFFYELLIITGFLGLCFGLFFVEQIQTSWIFWILLITGGGISQCIHVIQYAKTMRVVRTNHIYYFHEGILDKIDADQPTFSGRVIDFTKISFVDEWTSGGTETGTSNMFKIYFYMGGKEIPQLTLEWTKTTQELGQFLQFLKDLCTAKGISFEQNWTMGHNTQPITNLHAYLFPSSAQKTYDRMVGLLCNLIVIDALMFVILINGVTNSEPHYVRIGWILALIFFGPLPIIYYYYRKAKKQLQLQKKQQKT